MMLDQIRKALRTSDSDAAEIVAVETAHALTRFADSAIHQNVAESNWSVYARTVNGRRVGVAVGNDPATDALSGLLARARAVGAEQPEQPDFPGLPTPAATVPIEAWHASTAEATPVRRADMVAAVVRRLERDRLRASGSCYSSAGRVCVASSNGVAVEQPLTTAGLRVVALGEQGMGLAETTDRDIDLISPEEVAAEAAGVAVRNREAQPLAEGAYRALLMPPCLRDVMNWLSFTAFGSKSWLDGTSFLAGKLGARSLSPQVTIVDDAHDPAAPGLAFDYEGLPRGRVDLIVGGENRGVCLDRVSAREAGMAPTGHAPLPGSAYGGTPDNMAMSAGAVPSDELLDRLGTGILVHHFHYVNGFLDPRRALMTGMTRYGTFWVESGKIRHALKNLRWTQSFLSALGEGLVALGSRRETFFGRGANTCTTPAAIVDGFHVTGTTG